MLKVGDKMWGYVTQRLSADGKDEMSEICESPEAVLKKYPMASQNGIFKLKIKVDTIELEPAIEDGK